MLQPKNPEAVKTQSAFKITEHSGRRKQGGVCKRVGSRSERRSDDLARIIDRVSAAFVSTQCAEVQNSTPLPEDRTNFPRPSCQWVRSAILSHPGSLTKIIDDTGITAEIFATRKRC